MTSLVYAVLTSLYHSKDFIRYNFRHQIEHRTLKTHKNIHSLIPDGFFGQIFLFEKLWGRYVYHSVHLFTIT